MRRRQAYPDVSVSPEGDAIDIRRPDGSALPRLGGRHVEAMFRNDARELVFLTHDVLTEEQLDICLIEGAVLLDRLSLARMFQAAQLRNLRQLHEREFEFCFPSDVGWRLKIHETPKWRWPDLRPQISHLRLFRSYFSIARSEAR